MYPTRHFNLFRNLFQNLAEFGITSTKSGPESTSYALEWYRRFIRSLLSIEKNDNGSYLTFLKIKVKCDILADIEKRILEGKLIYPHHYNIFLTKEVWDIISRMHVNVNFTLKSFGVTTISEKYWTAAIMPNNYALLLVTWDRDTTNMLASIPRNSGFTRIGHAFIIDINKAQSISPIKYLDIQFNVIQRAKKDPTPYYCEISNTGHFVAEFLRLSKLKSDEFMTEPEPEVLTTMIGDSAEMMPYKLR